MSQFLKQTKFQLASDKIVKENLSDELKKVRKKRSGLKESTSQNIQPQPFGIEVGIYVSQKSLIIDFTI